MLWEIRIFSIAIWCAVAMTAGQWVMIFENDYVFKMRENNRSWLTSYAYITYMHDCCHAFLQMVYGTQVICDVFTSVWYTLVIYRRLSSNL